MQAIWQIARTDASFQPNISVWPCSKKGEKGEQMLKFLCLLIASLHLFNHFRGALFKGFHISRDGIRDKADQNRHDHNACEDHQEENDSLVVVENAAVVAASDEDLTKKRS